MSELRSANRTHAPDLERTAENQRPKTGDWAETKLYRYDGTDLYQWFGRRVEGIRRSPSAFWTACDEPFVIESTRPRTEGRGEGQPVAWQEAAEPFFRLAREVINPVNGERPWHADSKDWMVVFSFAGQSVTLGDLRRAAVASPIREPEISKEALIETMRQHIKADAVGLAPAVIAHYLVGFEEAADAILNLASPVAKGASQDAELSDEFDRPGRLSDATRHSAEGAADPALSGTRGVVTPVGGRGEATIAALTKALAAWHSAFETGRSEPLYAARDHSARTVAELLFAPQEQGGMK